MSSLPVLKTAYQLRHAPELTFDNWTCRFCCRYGAVDVLVQPSRGEGWGLPMVEAMACGTPVIGTRWSGPAEFLTEENSYPLRTDGLVPNHGAVCCTSYAPSIATIFPLYINSHRSVRMRARARRSEQHQTLWMDQSDRITGHCRAWRI